MIKSLLIPLLLLPLPLFAQAQPLRTMLLFAPLQPLEKPLYYPTTGPVGIVEAKIEGLAEPVPYEGPPRLALYATEADAAAAAEGTATAPSPVASLQLPLSDRVLVVAAPAANGRLGVVAYDISASTMDNGDYRFFNFSKEKLAVIIDKQRFVLSSGEDHVASQVQWHTQIMDMPIRIALVNSQQQATPVLARRWGHRPIRRNLVFLFDGPPSEPLRVIKLYDVLPTQSDQASSATRRP